MKPTHFLPPVLALLIAGGFVGAQRQEISKLEQESAVLRTHIASARELSVLPINDGTPSRADKPKEDPDPIDWAEMATVFSEMKTSGGVTDMRKMMSFQSRLQKMDKQELLAAFDRIAELDLADEERTMLETMLLGPLVLKDPELALTRFSKNLGDEKNMLSWQLGSALGEWAKKDAAAATAWFEKEIAAGTFDSKSLDGKSRVRMNFESALIGQLVSTDLAAAEARVAALPEDQRKDVLGNFGLRQVKESDQAALAGLVRSQLSEEDKLEVFGNQATSIAMGGKLEKVGDYLDRIAATPEERVSTAEKAALGNLQGKFFQSKIKTEDVDSMREWLGTEAPGSVDRVTGESIARATSYGDGMKFEEAADLALQYHESTGNDEVLTGFLENAGRYQHQAEARALAEKISDPKKRAEILKNLE